jgi:hypothetical protein
MRKVLVALGAVAAAFAVALPALAHDGARKEERKGEERSGKVCREFELAGSVAALAERSVTVAVEKAAPGRLELAGTDVQLGVGSRTRVHGELAVGARVHASGFACRLDEADAPAFFTAKLKVKAPKAERPRGSFKLAGAVAAVADDALDVAVDEASVESLVGKTVRVRIGEWTEVDGELAAGARVLVAGKARIVGGEAVLVALLVLVEDGGGE